MEPSQCSMQTSLRLYLMQLNGGVHMSSRRNLSLAPRAEDTRDAQPISVVNFELSEIKEHFDQSLTAINNQFEVALSLGSDGKIDDQKNIYRSQIVFLESGKNFVKDYFKYPCCYSNNRNFLMVSRISVFAAVKAANMLPCSPPRITLIFLLAFAFTQNWE